MKFYHKKIFTHNPERFALLAAILLAIVLFAAAFAKIVYPFPQLIILDRIEGICEVLIGCALIIFHKKKEVWMTASVVFALLGGYSLFWTAKGVPCGCLGAWAETAPSFFLLLDVIAVGLSLMFAHLFGAKRKSLYKCLIAVFLGLVVGYLFASAL